MLPNIGSIYCFARRQSVWRADHALCSTRSYDLPCLSLPSSNYVREEEAEKQTKTEHRQVTNRFKTGLFTRAIPLLGRAGLFEPLLGLLLALLPEVLRYETGTQGSDVLKATPSFLCPHRLKLVSLQNGF